LLKIESNSSRKLICFGGLYQVPFIK